MIVNNNLNKKNFLYKITWRCWKNQIKKNYENIFRSRYTWARARTHTRACALISIFTPVIQSLYIHVFIVYQSLWQCQVFLHKKFFYLNNIFLFCTLSQVMQFLRKINENTNDAYHLVFII